MDLFKDFLTSFTGNSDYNLYPLTGDASNRQYYRVSLGGKTWILMAWEAFEDSEKFPFLSIHKYFENSGIRVPRIYRFSKEKGLFIIEDLGDFSLEKCFWSCFNENGFNSGLPGKGENDKLSGSFDSQKKISVKNKNHWDKDLLKIYTKVMDQLIRVHSLYFEEKNREVCVVYKQEFSVEKFLWELNFSKNHLLKGLLKIPISEREEKILNKEFEILCKNLCQSPQVICHRDFHSRNVMLKSGKEVVIIDFQDARMGPVVYDLVSLFCDSYVRLDSSFIGYLMGYYKDHFPYFSKLRLEEDQWQELFEQQVLQRCFKACGSFACFENFGKKRSYLSYIRPTLLKILKKTENWESYPLWRELLEKSKPVWGKF